MIMQNAVLQQKPELSLSQASSLHVAIICDGNGRWATSQLLPRAAGHRAGANAARKVIRCAPHLGIHTLTLFALSSANWQRPLAEVTAILHILEDYLREETCHCMDEGIRLSILGRRDRLPAPLRGTIERSEALTAKERGSICGWLLIIRRAGPSIKRQQSFTRLRNSVLSRLGIFLQKFSVADHRM